jgi:hypothetical protein
MKTTQLRAEEGRSAQRDAYESRAAGGTNKWQTSTAVLRQIIREELAAR